MRHVVTAPGLLPIVRCWYEVAYVCHNPLRRLLEVLLDLFDDSRYICASGYTGLCVYFMGLVFCCEVTQICVGISLGVNNVGETSGSNIG